MTMNKQIKIFDAVQMMREIRDKISAETEHMTFEELKSYMKRKLSAANEDVA